MKTLLFFILILHIPLASAQTLQVAVASNFLTPFKALKKKFVKERKVTISTSSGSTGKLAAQIQRGAPYDLFFSADQKRITFLEEKDLILKKSRVTYALGRLALFLPKHSVKNQTLREAFKTNFEHLSMANPKLAPYGLAAKDVLQKLTLWNSLEEKIVYGNNISQAYQFVITGAADAGLVAYPQVKSRHQKKNVIKIPNKWHSPIIQQAAILKRTQHPKLAKDLLGFIQGPKGQKIIHSFGYQTTGEGQP